MKLLSTHLLNTLREVKEKLMHHLYKYIKATLIIWIMALCWPVVYAEDKIVITVNQFVSHPALDAAYNGLKAGFVEREISDKISLIVGNSQGNISNSIQVSKHQASLNPRFMVAIGTPAAQTILKAKLSNSTLAFLAVTDPESAGLINRRNVMGVSCGFPVKGLMKVVLNMMPSIQNVGVIFNSGEINSVKMVEILSQILESKNIGLKKISINSSNDIKNAFDKLAGKVEVIYLPQDNSLISALDSIVKLSKARNIPLIANDPTLVERGVLVAYGSNYYQNGIQLAHMIADMLEGKEVSSKIQNSETNDLKLNERLAQDLNIVIE